jgi:hypothetical protein
MWRECAIAARQEDAGVEQSPERVPAALTARDMLEGSEARVFHGRLPR